MVLKRILHGQMTEKIASEVRPKKGKTLQKVLFLKRFLTTWPLGGEKKLYHKKFKSKISYLGEKVSILPWQITEQLYVKVRPKKRQKTSKILFLKCILWPLPKTWDKLQNHFWKDFSCSLVLKSILHGQMTEEIAFELRPKKGKKYIIHVDTTVTTFNLFT